MQYLYDDGDSLVFMDSETYDQESISKEFVDNILDYIKEGDLITVSQIIFFEAFSVLFKKIHV